MAAALVAGTAMAVSPKQISTMSVNTVPNMAQKVEQARLNITNALEGRQLASSSGIDWTVRVNVNPYRWNDLLIFGEEGIKYSFEELPYYWVTFYVYNSDEKTAIYFDAVWPAQAYLDHGDDDDWFVGSGDDEMFDWDRAVEEYGTLEAAEEPASLESMIDVMNADENEKEPLYQFPYGSLPAYYGLFNMQLMGQNSSTYHGTGNYWLKPGTRQSDGRINMSGAAYLLLNAYDAETMEIDMTMHAPMGPATSSYDVTVKATVDDTLNEGAAVFGFSPISLTPSEVHYFNLGAMSADYELGDGYTMGDLYEDFVPANLYFVAYCTAPLTFEGTYTASSLPSKLATTGEDPSTDQYNYFTSYFTLEPNADPENTVPQGIATYTWYEFDGSGFLTNEIGPGMLWPSGYYSPKAPDSQTVVDYLGGDGAIYGWRSMPEPTFDDNGELTGLIAKIGLGDKNNGFNSLYKSSLGSVVSVKYTGNVKYHYDSADYTKVKEVPAVGTADANTLGVKAIAGVSNAAVVGVEYYNFQGARLATAPQKGLYIVRELKADGTVSVKKVAK